MHEVPYCCTQSSALPPPLERAHGRGAAGGASTRTRYSPNCTADPRRALSPPGGGRRWQGASDPPGHSLSTSLDLAWPASGLGPAARPARPGGAGGGGG
eukprot:scaffold1388_cov390-Prasinococcus_capsulatus_cf.AAC.2